MFQTARDIIISDVTSQTGHVTALYNYILQNMTNLA